MWWWIALAVLVLLFLFWHLADRWGRVTKEGIVIPLKLTRVLDQPAAPVTRLPNTGGGFLAGQSR